MYIVCKENKILRVIIELRYLCREKNSTPRRDKK